MTQYIAPADLAGLTEQDLRALHARILSDLRRLGLAAQDCSEIFATLQNIQQALVRLQQQPRPRPPKGPGF